MSIDHSELDARIAAQQAEFEAARRTFEEALGLLVGEFTTSFPAGGLAGNRDGLAQLGSRLEDLAGAYDGFQASIGLSDGERTRFAEFFTGREGVYGRSQPPPWHRAG